MKYFILLFILLLQVVDTKAQGQFTKKADSLFKDKNYSEAAILYEELLAKHSINRSNCFLKLAFINEQKGDFPRAIYYLSEYFHLNPSENTFSKINKMAEENSFSGYARSDLNFLLLIYERYYLWISLAFVLIVCYSFYVLVLKRLKHEETALRHKLSFVLLVLLSLGFLNVDGYFRHGIVKNQHIYLREAPSAGAEVSLTMAEGSKVNVIGEKDIWLRLLVNGKIQFGKKSDFWIIDKN